jgi:NADH dehydrogenase (ubiquinone) flavoprotein 2
MQAIKEYANIEMDETSEDGLFTISEVECLGACVNAPMMQVNNEWVYEVIIHTLS